jgi:hypothetical protein
VEIENSHSKGKCLFLSQKKYISDMLNETNKLDVKSMKSNKKLYIEEGEPLKDINQYQRLVDKLIYLIVTRPNITFVVSLVSQFMHASMTTHLEAVDRILRYLKKSPYQGIWMKKNNTNTIISYSDADWIGSYGRKSTT